MKASGFDDIFSLGNLVIHFDPFDPDKPEEACREQTGKVAAELLELQSCLEQGDTIIRKISSAERLEQELHIAATKCSVIPWGNAPGLTPSLGCRRYTPGGVTTFMWHPRSQGDLPHDSIKVDVPFATQAEQLFVVRGQHAGSTRR